jgi:uncharacterized phage protein (TIGR02216 family)
MDWSGLLKLGLGRLRLTPSEFWRLTPAELLLMLGIEGSSAPMTRARLDELVKAFPDSGGSN